MNKKLKTYKKFGGNKMDNNINMTNVRLHVVSDNEKINLSDLIDVLTNLKLSINDVYRKYEIKNLYKESPVVKNLENGSVIIDLLVNLGVNLLATSISDLLKNRFTKKKYEVNEVKDITNKNNIYNDSNVINNYFIEVHINRNNK